MDAHKVSSCIKAVVISFMLVAVTGCRDETGSGSTAKKDNQVAKIDDIAKEKGPDGQPIIFWRIKQENRDAISAMLDAGYDIEIKGGFDATPIIGAALIDDWQTVLLLLKRGANPMVADRRGFTLNDLMNTSRVDPKGSYGVALEEVRALLKQRGVSDKVYEPPQVKEMLKNDEWPPAN